jgi:hypothetical protein
VQHPLTRDKMLEVNDEVPGTSELIAWFGHWPSFHDAEVVEVALHRRGNSTIRIHAFETTNQVDSQGFFIQIKDVIVTFILAGVTNLHLEDFSAQNVISELLLKQKAEGYELTLGGCYGIQGTITADRIQIELLPGLPADSQYLNVDRI